jgi:hypothetical protein
VNCIICIEHSLKDQVLNDKTTVQFAVDGAKTAVTIRGGKPLCVEHLHEAMVGDAVLSFTTRS